MNHPNRKGCMDLVCQNSVSVRLNVVSHTLKPRLPIQTEKVAWI